MYYFLRPIRLTNVFTTVIGMPTATLGKILGLAWKVRHPDEKFNLSKVVKGNLGIIVIEAVYIFLLFNIVSVLIPFLLVQINSMIPTFLKTSIGSLIEKLSSLVQN